MKFRDFKQKLKALPVFSTSMLGALTVQVGTLRVQLSNWKKKRLVQCLRKGLYVLSREERQIEPSLFYLANQIYMPSYVSLESALSYYGLIPEFVGATTSVTVRKTCRFENEFGIFTYQHIQPKTYHGFGSVQESEGMSILVASPEKALVDFFYLNLDRFSVSDRLIFKESFRFQNSSILEPKKLRMFAEKFGTKKLFAVVELFMKETMT